MIRLMFAVDGETQLDRAIQRFTEGVSDLTPAWELVRDYFWAAEREVFETEGGAGGAGEWAPLSPAYAKWKAAHYPGSSILMRTRALEGSLTGQNEGAIVNISPLGLSIGSAVAYGLFHQRGTGAMPQRKVISLSDRNRRQIVQIVQRFLVDAARGA